MPPLSSCGDQTPSVYAVALARFDDTIEAGLTIDLPRIDLIQQR
ncbi:hypothetical protein X971_2232 [Agrobacterium tumefaciens LBA4213 (Ach5)]|nr:hypothetical protein X971_2232 [Agrobacterium tumefaciens LBA4213 (Ach5)]